jgi:hypothetical protein
LEVTNVTDHKFKNGVIYTGQVKIVEGASVKHGLGTKKWADGSSYIGDWRNGVATGNGTFSYFNGDVYTGQYSKDKANGKGLYTHQNGQKNEG